MKRLQALQLAYLGKASTSITVYADGYCVSFMLIPAKTWNIRQNGEDDAERIIGEIEHALESHVSES